ncbi:MAG: 4Fe-4S binding protein [Smithellaceae bacterium]|nr:4Fe-4S binding protein [Smithellaceae bacterium]
MEKEAIREYARGLGADVVGFAAAGDYRSARTPGLATILPGVQSMVVLGYREIDGALDSANMRTAMSSRMAVMDLAKRNVYLLARRLEDNFNGKAAPASYPLDMGHPNMGLLTDVSLRHAAVAAGLGIFGRHNLVINPRHGSRLIFSAVICDLPFASDPPCEEDLCTECGLCVESCPARALDEEGKTADLKCLKVSQPFGIGRAMGYVKNLMAAEHDERKKLLSDPLFLQLYQASFIGFQYNCFRCIAVGPVSGPRGHVPEARRDRNMSPE